MATLDAVIDTSGLQEFCSMQLTPPESSTSSPARPQEDTKSAEGPIRDKAHQNAQRIYETLIRGTFEHNELRPRVWCVTISTHPEFFGSLVKYRFARIMKYDTLSGPLFTI